jgi:hypothetical protein
MMSAAPMPFKNKIALQAPQPFSLAKGQVMLQAPQEMIADAYLWDGAPSNKRIPDGAYLPYYTGLVNSKLMAAQLAAAYPLDQKFKGYAPVERRPVATNITRSPMSWKGVWGGVSGGR